MDKHELLNKDIDSKKRRERIRIEPNSTLLFIGDSITDAGRDRADGDDLGHGYPALVAAQLLNKYPSFDLNILNRGISGDKVGDLKNRWDADCLELSPDLVSLLIGINDVGFLAEKGETETTENLAKFEEDYRYLLKSLAQRTDARVVLLEPFVLPYPKSRQAWRPYLDPRIQIIRRLANDYQVVLIPLDGLINSKGIENGYQTYTGNDGVHPTLTGHAFIAETWLRQLNL